MKRKSFEGHFYVLITNRLNSSERTFKSYTLLLRLVPQLKDMLNDSSVDTDTFDHFISQVQCFFVSSVSVSLNIFRSFKRVQMMHAVTMSGA
jgi:hypothetical protein